MPYFTLLDDDLTTEITDYDFTTVGPGKEIHETLGILNNFSNLADINLEIWPGLKNNQYSGDTMFTSIKIIKMNAAEEKQVTFVAKENSDAIATAINSSDDRPVVLKYDGNYTVQATIGEIGMMDSINEAIIIGSDYPYPNLAFEFSHPGSYDAISINMMSSDNTNFYECSGTFDYTSLLSNDGNITIGTIDDDFGNYGKKTLAGYHKYWTKIGCSGTVHTQATFDAIFWETYQLGKKNISENPFGFYRKAAGPTYTATTEPDFKYNKMGKFAYYNSPILSSEELVIEYNYQLPQPGDYTFEFLNSDTVRMTDPTGATFDNTVLSDGIYRYYNILDGVELIFSTSCETGSLSTISFSDASQYTFLGTSDTYFNSDINLGNVASGASVNFNISHRPPFSIASGGNERYFEFWAEEA